MDRTDSSLMSSLEHLSDMGRERAREQETEKNHRERRSRVDALVAENRRRRVERARVEAARERARMEEAERLEAEARLRGRQAAEIECARIRAAHEARMRELALVHQHERERLAQRGDRRRVVLAWCASLFAVAWLITLVAALSDRPTATRIVAEAVSSPVTASFAPQPEAETATEIAIVTPAPVEEATPPIRTTSRPYPVRPAVTPRLPDPEPEGRPCNDTIGDPCCAFGRIAC